MVIIIIFIYLLVRLNNKMFINLSIEYTFILIFEYYQPLIINIFKYQLYKIKIENETVKQCKKFFALNNVIIDNCSIIK